MAPGGGFDRKFESGSVSVRVLEFVGSRGSCCLREVYEGLGVSPSIAEHSLRVLWKRGLVLRTRQPEYVFELANKGRAGVFGYTRSVTRFALNDGRDLPADFVKYEERHKDGRSRECESKAAKILAYLKEHSDQAFYSRDITNALKVKPCDVMANVRRFEKQGLVYVRGYQSHDNRSPFSKGYILTYIDQNQPRDTAVKQAFDRTSKIITDKPTSNTIHERIRLIRDQLLTSNQLLSQSYFRQILDCPIDGVKLALKRAKQLYSDIKEVRIFDTFAYYYLDTMKPEDLAANIELKKNYIRVRYGRENRVGHNWEACVEWFIDKFTEGAEFQKQNHRQKMDPKRITLHLLKPVGDRKQSAEIDRIWKVTPGLFSPTVTYVLECKWSIVTKKTLDDFLEVLKWSTDFGVDTENGRELKKSVVPVFAAGTFNPKEQVTVNNEKINLSTYAYRLNIKLLRSADFNQKLREHGIGKKVTVQKICQLCSNEKEIRATIETIWDKSSKAAIILEDLTKRNDSIWKFETQLIVN